MILRHRPMQLEDIRECVDIVANHPVVGPRYGSAIELLPDALARLIECEAHAADVILAGQALGAPICWAGVSVFVTDKFLVELKKPPHFWIGAELTRRIAGGESPLLAGKELREANTRHGLNLVCWEACTGPGYVLNGELMRYIMTVFVERHRGYLWKEVISSQHESPDFLAFVLRTGGRLWDASAGGYTDTFPENLAEVVRKPHVVGITRDMDHGQLAGSWAGALFDYHPPVLGFSRSEQRLLTRAMSGVTDEQLAETLGISLSAVKKMWISVHRRVEDRVPELVSDASTSAIPGNGRGKEKRRRLLGWLRDHAEELRPFSRSLLKQHARAQSIATLKGMLG